MSEEQKTVIVRDQALGKGLATVGICFLGAVSMYVTNGNTGIGWAILGTVLVWGC